MFPDWLYCSAVIISCVALTESKKSNPKATVTIIAAAEVRPYKASKRELAVKPKPYAQRQLERTRDYIA